MTPRQKAWIDGASYESLLSKWRNAPSGDPFFEGATYDYYSTVMAVKRNAPGGDAAHVAASKSIGWKGDRL
jgi:hypothetical protein